MKKPALALTVITVLIFAAAVGGVVGVLIARLT